METQTADIAEKVLAQGETKPETAKTEPVARVPKKNCRHCYGRGHMGKNTLTGLYVPCYCVEEPDKKKARLYQEELARRFGRK